MMTMEGGEEDARQSLSLHPLYEEYLFPAEGDGGEEPVPFYYSPYSGELSLKFPKASKKCRGGILADGGLAARRQDCSLIVSSRDGSRQDNCKFSMQS
jgi:DNA repair protein RAD5